MDARIEVFRPSSRIPTQVMQTLEILNGSVLGDGCWPLPRMNEVVRGGSCLACLDSST